jgi:hypothetical protein
MRRQDSEIEEQRAHRRTGLGLQVYQKSENFVGEGKIGNNKKKDRKRFVLNQGFSCLTTLGVRKHHLAREHGQKTG